MIQYQSQSFGKTRKDIKKDEVSINAQLLMRAGFIEKAMAGVYVYLPMGLRVFRNIENIIRQEMNALGGQEMLMSAFQPKEIWEPTGRWQNRVGGAMYQFKDSSDKDIGLAPSHEEMVVDIAKRQIESYKDLPIFVYQIQDKFRDEPRAKSGLLRGREFFMKDLYAFTTTHEENEAFYKKVHEAYLNIFKRLGLTAFSVEASGGEMSKKYSHEFMVETPAGEDITVIDTNTGVAQNKEVANHAKGADTKEVKTVEVGNIFDQETFYSDALGLQFTDKDGKRKSVWMSAYGIGLSRAMGTIVEASHDEKGIIWTKEVTPFHVHVIGLSQSEAVMKARDEIVKQLSSYDVLVDDRDESVGQKLNDADLIGIPYQIIVGEKSLPEVEFKDRRTYISKKIKIKDVATLLSQSYVE